MSSPVRPHHAPSAEAPNAKAPNAEAPNAKAPNAEAPNAKAPNAEAPNAEARSAEATSPEAAVSRSLRLDDTDLSAFIAGHGIPAELCYPGVATPTVPDAARALGVESGAIIKSLVFETQGAPCLVIAAGEVRIAYKLLADALSVSRRQLRMVTPEAALEITGFPVGAMPPFGHHQPLPTFVDSRSVPRGATVYGGGGTRNALLRVEVDTLLRVTTAQYLPLTASS